MARGVPQNHTEAARLYRLAADQGHAQAQCNLAAMSLKGTGVPQDHAVAARPLKLAAGQGFQPAREALGHLTAGCPAGTRIRIAGLTTAAHLNCRLGTVVQPTKLLVCCRPARGADRRPTQARVALCGQRAACLELGGTAR